MDDLDVLKRDRFELLSAYLDGEVTPVERQQVETWLATDSESQRLYRRLLTLQSGFQDMPAIAPSLSADRLASQVICKAQQRRPRLLLVWGGLGAAIAAAAVGVITNVLPGNAPMPQLAVTTSASLEPNPNAIEPTLPENLQGLGLMLSLDRPPIEIPDVILVDDSVTSVEHSTENE
ncbi:zf-HC2 domain-containing protein [Candidatus Synechococcus calcipolaris G9]|uniref:Zf-HC2 domain-containing protein n=1 Tax=Candidatus Synechococcus calcipolaris G9 TaxID=1497997 RepID=A0ABT6EWN5_9SYNE|nr:zf-HC2 domain-containing protein [Candidatus Synechococcus calcipolaris]MDG2990189.1 zf-HC2 domain-containing protein [Candidatus Synechococcus calcipolaris G9]